MAYVKLGSKAVGSIVKFKVNDTSTNFIVANQSSSGVGLIREDILTTDDWADSNSTQCTTFYEQMQSDIKAQVIKQDAGYVFLLSSSEASGDWTYFSSDERRIAYYNEDSADWWLRNGKGEELYSNSSDGATIIVFEDVYYVTGYGFVTTKTILLGGSGRDYGVRPAFVLPATLMVSDDGTVVTNVAPDAPVSITVPSSITGGTSVTVSWAAATDTDGNLEGYKLERSTDGGATWTQIYQGAATSTANTVAFGTTSVMYRVKAYDSEGEESAYKTSGQVTVVNNKAPGNPPSISVPKTVTGGKTLVITWTASTDTDGNLSGYILERSTDGGTTYSQIYKGTKLTYTDTIDKTWSTVQYRVCAYDPYTKSGYTTGEARTVVTNAEPTITCSTADGTNLGTKTDGFSISYSVNDTDSADTLTVTETLDGTTKRSFTATRGTSYTFDLTGTEWMKVLNGSHTMVISVTDSKATTKRTFTFTKKVKACSITLKTPLAVSGDITVCVIHVNGSIPSDATYSVKVTNNANDDTPVWQDCTSECKSGTNIVFENTVAANGPAFNFVVEASEGTSGTGGYISAVTGAFQ